MWIVARTKNKKIAQIVLISIFYIWSATFLLHLLYALWFCCCLGSTGAKNLKARFENIAKNQEEEAKKQADRVKLSRKASEDRERTEQKHNQEVSKTE